MQIQCHKTYSHIPRIIMQKCGYAEITTKQGKRSYIKLLRGVPYPRFHAYLEVQDTGFQINLHLDQKAPVYSAGSAHAGEYDGAVVEAEGQRISAIVEQFAV